MIYVAMTTLIPGNAKALKAYGIPFKGPIICERMFNNANHNVCSITYTLDMSKHTFCPNYFA